MRPLACMLLAAGCLDFAPGTPNQQMMMPGGSPDMAKPAMQQQTPHDMAMAPNQSMPPMPGADLAMAPPAPLGNQLCDVTMTLAGTYTQGNAPPVGFPGGCWPDGTWTFSATITSNTCNPTPSIQAQYKFTVVEDMDFNDTITYNNDPAINMTAILKLSGGEGGVCVGGFILFSADGKTVYNLRPAMQA